MTGSQLRRLAATMRVLEEGLEEIELELTEHRERAMTVFENDIPASARPAMLETIQLLSAEISKVKRGYGLEPQIVSNRKRFTAKLSSLSVDLIEATSKYMKAYGEVPEEEKVPLDSQIATMIGLVEELKSLVADELSNG
jgi:hypothetical protein